MINLNPEYAAKAIARYLAESKGKNHRYRSWEHCYLAFAKARRDLLERRTVDYDLLALHLSNYLASWGMFRNSFLQDRDYRTQLEIVNILFDDRSNDLLLSFPSDQDDEALNIETLQKHWNAIKVIWDAFSRAYGVGSITDTLVSKVLLGTFGSVPATDRYYKTGVKSFEGTQYFGSNSYSEIVRYYWSKWDEISSHLAGTTLATLDDPSTPYPPMKLMDMCFWQIGYSIELYDKNRGENLIFSALAENEKYVVLQSLLGMPAN